MVGVYWKSAQVMLFYMIIVLMLGQTNQYCNEDDMPH